MRSPFLTHRPQGSHILVEMVTEPKSRRVLGPEVHCREVRMEPRLVCNVGASPQVKCGLNRLFCCRIRVKSMLFSFSTNTFRGFRLRGGGEVFLLCHLS